MYINIQFSYWFLRLKKIYKSLWVLAFLTFECIIWSLKFLNRTVWEFNERVKNGEQIEQCASTNLN
jgi:hypothetical protein